MRGFEQGFSSKTMLLCVLAAAWLLLMFTDEFLLWLLMFGKLCVLEALLLLVLLLPDAVPQNIPCEEN